MVEAHTDEVRAGLERFIGKPLGPASVALDPVNLPMIRHWADALDDRNPVYLDEAFAKRTRHGGLVAPARHELRAGVRALPAAWRPPPHLHRAGVGLEPQDELAVHAANDLGGHATGTVALTLRG